MCIPSPRTPVYHLSSLYTLQAAECLTGVTHRIRFAEFDFSVACFSDILSSRDTKTSCFEQSPEMYVRLLADCFEITVPI